MSDTEIVSVPVIGWVCGMCGHIWAFAVAVCTCGYVPAWLPAPEDTDDV